MFFVCLFFKKRIQLKYLKDFNTETRGGPNMAKNCKKNAKSCITGVRQTDNYFVIFKQGSGQLLLSFVIFFKLSV